MASDLPPPSKKELAKLRRALRSRAMGVWATDQIYTHLFGLAEPKHTVGYIDRMIAIVGTTYLELGLEQAVSKHFSDRHPPSVRNRIFRGDGERPGPLGEFYGKIEVAYVLGVISEQAKEDFHTIREIRNAFAHSMVPMDFSTEVVAKLLAHLHIKIPSEFRAVFELPGLVTRKLIYFISTYHFRLSTYDPELGEPIEPLP